MAVSSKERNKKLLLEITSIPTATGKEHRVMRYIFDWVARRSWVETAQDKFGNLLLSVKNKRSRKPIVLEVHMDHPAFVAGEVSDDGKEVWADFRGGVQDEYFVGSSVRFWPGFADKKLSDIQQSKFSRQDNYASLVDRSDSKKGIVTEFLPADAKAGRLYKRAKISFKRRTKIKSGDVLTWDLPAARIVGNKLKTPVCDNLASAAAALCAFDEWYKKCRRKISDAADVRVLFSRAEEIGFIGAIGACESKIIPKASRVIVLETSKSIPHDSPQGDGPIIRVGDRVSTFDCRLNTKIAQICTNLKKQDDSFQFQRKLMPGGACNATAYLVLGYAATCLCLPLVNYHNMNEVAKKIDRECIDIRDYHGYIRMLVAVFQQLDVEDEHNKPLDQTLRKHFKDHQYVLADD